MNIKKNVLDLVGNTPLVELNNIKEIYGFKGRILAKVERNNPTGSVKDRIAKAMLIDAMDKKKITPKTLVVEPTSGNTGIGIAAMCAALGIKARFYMPSTCSIERVNMMKAFGAEIFTTDGALGMKGAIDACNEEVKNNPNALLLSQFSNEANVKAHYLTTGPEIYKQTENNINVFLAGFGTGGTISGVGQFLKEMNSKIKVIGVEPENSPFVTKGVKGPHKIQGIGAGFKPDNLHMDFIDEVRTVKDEDAIKITKELWKKEGLFVGISSGANVSVAINYLLEHKDEDITLVTVLPDNGERYLSVEVLHQDN